MAARSSGRPWAPSRIRARWRARAPHLSRPLSALLMALDVLPWPRGEDILAGLFMIVGLARAGRRRAALGWARAQRGPRPWRLAAALCAYRGRWIARTRCLGVRHPEEWRRNLVVEGEAHLIATPGAAILLAFHVGPPGSDLDFRMLGYPVTFLGSSDRDATLGWWDEAWLPFVTPRPLSFTAKHQDRWTAVLYTGRQILADGGKIHTHADGIGKEAFRLSLSPGEWPVRAGWLMLHRATGAPVLPIFRRLEGRRHVTTIHPPLPPLDADPRGIEVWRERLTSLLEDYVRRHPEQCPHLAVMQSWGPAPLTAASASGPRTGPSTRSSGSG